MTQIVTNMPKTMVNPRKRSHSMPLLYKGVLLFACFAVIVWLFSTLFLRSYNINLSMEQQQIASKISALQVENDAIRVEIQSLNSRERVTNIASDAGLEVNQNNIVTVDGQ